MKTTALKKAAIVVMALIIAVTFSLNAFAETLQDRIEQRLQEIYNEYQNSSSSTEKQSIQEWFNELLSENNLGNIDLSSITDTDFAKIISDLGDNMALDDFMGLASDAWQSGIGMIKDVIGGGLGTSDGSNTATTNAPLQTQPTNVIVADVDNGSNETTTAVGIPSTVPAVEQTTEATTAAAIVGAGVTVPEQVSLPSVEDDNSGMSTSSIVVLVVLSVATLAVIVVLVVFFILKRK